MSFVQKYSRSNNNSLIQNFSNLGLSKPYFFSRNGFSKVFHECHHESFHAFSRLKMIYESSRSEKYFCI